MFTESLEEGVACGESMEEEGIVTDFVDDCVE